MTALALACVLALGTALAAAGLAVRARQLHAAVADARAAAHGAAEHAFNLLESVGEGVYVVDGALRITHVNEEAERLLRSTADALVGRALGEIVDPLGSELVPEIRAARGKRTVIERTQAFPATQTFVEIRIHAGAVETLVSLRDVSARARAELQLFETAYRDSLTGLPNRLALERRLNETIAEAKREGRQFAVLFLDLDRFKTINDSLGHGAGDEVLRAIAQRLEALVGARDVVARPGGDEFVILLSSLDEPAALQRLTQRLFRSLAAPVAVRERELHVSASTGVALYPEHGRDAEALLAHADAAMYRAKALGGNRSALHDVALETIAGDRLALENDLRLAVERGELELRYQPIVNVASERIVGCEALVRWRHPDRGLLLPDSFVPLAEETGAIVAIDRWVVREACAAAARIRTVRAGFCVSVNVSSRDLREPGLPELVAATLAEHGLPPAALAVEITETVSLDDSVLPVLRELHALGVRVAMDDFGVGFSSLSYLKRLPVNALKVDRSFVRDVAADPYDQAIVAAVVAVARALDFTVIAEGIETAEQLERIAALGCDQAQGYRFGKPQSLERLAASVAADERGAPAAFALS